MRASEQTRQPRSEIRSRPSEFVWGGRSCRLFAATTSSLFPPEGCLSRLLASRNQACCCCCCSSNSPLFGWASTNSLANGLNGPSTGRKRPAETRKAAPTELQQLLHPICSIVSRGAPGLVDGDAQRADNERCGGECHLSQQLGQNHAIIIIRWLLLCDAQRSLFAFACTSAASVCAQGRPLRAPPTRLGFSHPTRGLRELLAMWRSGNK